MVKKKLPAWTNNKLKIALAALALALLIGAGGTAGWFIYNLRAVAPTQTNAVSFSLPQGQKTTLIAQRLEEEGLIRSSSAFLAYISITGVRSKLQAGSYSLSPSHSVADIVGILSQGRIKTNLLIIPEGNSIFGIVDLAAEKGINKDDMRAALAANYNYDFLAGRPEGAGLEGYLFPDSYNVSDKTTAEELVTNMLENFGQKVPAKFQKAFQEAGFTLHQGLTLASIIEKEVAKPEERPLVAQVLLKRLSIGMRLETDPTVDYAAALLGVPFNLSLDSKYNTYRYAGLPPGPIANPGISALEAVLNPAKTDYLYFVTGKDKITRFSRTFAEHQQTIAAHGVSSK